MILTETGTIRLLCCLRFVSHPSYIRSIIHIRVPYHRTKARTSLHVYRLCYDACRSRCYRTTFLLSYEIQNDTKYHTPHKYFTAERYFPLCVHPKSTSPYWCNNAGEAGSYDEASTPSLHTAIQHYNRLSEACTAEATSSV